MGRLEEKLEAALAQEKSYGISGQAQMCTDEEYRQSLRERVQCQADHAARRAAESKNMNELAALLAKHPDVARIIELMEDFNG